MRGVNKVILIGNLGQDPDVRYLHSGAAVANITMATSESWKDKNTGQPIEHTEWHRIVFYAKLAEIAGEYLKKGSKVYIEGSLHTRKWQDKQGQDRYTTEIKASSLQMLDGKPRDDQQPEQHQAQRSSSNAYAQAREGRMPPASPPSDAFDDDIPFMDPYREMWRSV